MYIFLETSTLLVFHITPQIPLDLSCLSSYFLSYPSITTSSISRQIELSILSWVILSSQVTLSLPNHCGSMDCSLTLIGIAVTIIYK